MRHSASSTHAWLGAVLATVMILLTVAPAHSDNRITFAEILRGHARAALKLKHLPETTNGMAFTSHGVVVTATPQGVFVEGARLVALDHGHVAADSVRLCKNGMPCLPKVRRHIAIIRADLARVRESRPPVVIVADARIPYATVHLLVSTAAEAGAALSILIVARKPDGDLAGVPVWIAPATELTLGQSQEPALATVSIRGPSTAVSATRLYMDQPRRASNTADMKELLGRIELKSGRTTCFVNASDDTTLGQLIPVLVAIREIFPNVVLTGERGLRVHGQ